MNTKLAIMAGRGLTLPEPTRKGDTPGPVSSAAPHSNSFISSSRVGGRFAGKKPAEPSRVLGIMSALPAQMDGRWPGCNECRTLCPTVSMPW